MRIAMVGTRGVPARYGGFETAVEEIGRRLVTRGHQVVVYTRPRQGDAELREYLGMRLVPLAAVRAKSLETLTHSALSSAHAWTRRPADVVVLFNAANALYLPMLRAGGVPVAVHVDGLEWRRAKWGPIGKRFYRVSEALAVRYADAVIADAEGIASYYRDEFGAHCETIAYGAPVNEADGHDALPAGVGPRGYHLVVARFEPENHVLQIVRGYSASAARQPLLIVGGTPYSSAYQHAIEAAASRDPRITMLGPVWDQRVLDQLYGNALTYLHGHSVGGTNPSLLRAMGAGAPVLAWDVSFNREVAGPVAGYFDRPESLGPLLTAAEADPATMVNRGLALRERARVRYDWDAVTTCYEDLCRRLTAGFSVRKRVSGRRAADSAWGT